MEIGPHEARDNSGAGDRENTANPRKQCRQLSPLPQPDIITMAKHYSDQDAATGVSQKNNRPFTIIPWSCVEYEMVNSQRGWL